MRNPTSIATEKKELYIPWFRLMDLRIHDNPSLHSASQMAKKSGNVGILPVFCFDSRLFGNDARSAFGTMKCGPKRAKFILEGVKDLRNQLEMRGSGLVVAHGTPEEIFSKILLNADSNRKIIPKLYCQQEVCSEELSVDKKVRASISAYHPKSSLTRVWGSTLYEIDDLPFNDGVYGMPNVFSTFRNKVEKKANIGQPLPVPSNIGLKLADVNTSKIDKCSLSYMPSLKDLGYTDTQVESANENDERGVMPFIGGETAGLNRVKDYIWEKDLLKKYFDTRNGMIGANYSTKFSPWLAHGNISPRFIAQECKRYETVRVANKSTYWVIFELLWRDFFKFFALQNGNKIFFEGGTIDSSKRWGYDNRHFDAWKEGRTGYPLVDANMREVAATGFMSNRGRQNVCSFLALDMNHDWRCGADYFESILLDYDVHSNWGNWCAGAGMTGGRVNRFNIVKQSKDYDPNGDYVRLWLPELKDVPNEFIHEPWKMTPFHQMEYEVKIGVDYPRPLIPPFSSKNSNGRNGGGDRGRGGKSGGRDQQRSGYNKHGRR